MTKKIKAIIAIGGTGGHVFPGCNLANHLIDNGYEIKLVTDKRGLNFLEKYKNLNIFTLPSSPLQNKNLITFIYSTIKVFYSIIRSLIFLVFNRPRIIFGMGGYASFPICIAAWLLKIEFVIYENNLIIGKANKYLLPFAKKVFVSYEELEGIPLKYANKILLIGNIIKNEIINFSQTNKNLLGDKKINILVLGGSQAAKIFAKTLPSIFCESSNQGINLKVYQHCLPNQNEKLKALYQNSNIDYEIFNFSNNLEEYFLKANLAITRSGSSMLAELTNANIPFISVPLPSSADNHQLINAIYYKNKKYSFLIEEKDLNTKLSLLLKDINNDSSILDKIRENQSQYSDKNVYKNINNALKVIINEKN